MKTETEIVESANDLARKFFAAFGNRPEDKNFNFYESENEQDQGFFRLAIIAFEHIEGTDVEDALTILEGE